MRDFKICSRCLNETCDAKNRCRQRRRLTTRIRIGGGECIYNRRESASADAPACRRYRPCGGGREKIRPLRRHRRRGPRERCTPREREKEGRAAAERDWSGRADTRVHNVIRVSVYDTRAPWSDGAGPMGYFSLLFRKRVPRTT